MHCGTRTFSCYVAWVGGGEVSAFTSMWSRLLYFDQETKEECGPWYLKAQQLAYDVAVEGEVEPSEARGKVPSRVSSRIRRDSLRRSAAQLNVT